MSIEQLKADLQTAIQQAEHKPGDWSQTAQSMGGICCPGEKFQIGKPWPKEQPWAHFSYKRDSWLAVAAVNALPGLLAEIERLEAQVRLAGVSAEITVHQEVGRAATEALAIAAERDMLKAENERLRPVVDAVLSESANGAHIRPGNSPWHDHTVPGVWDSGNGDRAGTECGWCKAWNAAQALVQEQGHDA